MCAISAAEVAANMAEFSEVEPDSSGVQPGSRGLKYWRRKDGWIVRNQAAPTESERNRRKGMVSLDDYGEFFEFNKDEPLGRGKKVWYPRLEPYRRILLNDGAKEFCIEQIVESGWHVKPPYKGVSFPQMDGVKVYDEKCGVCGKKFYALNEDKVNVLRSGHELIRHTDTAQQQGYARAMASALNTNPANATLATALQALVAHTTKQDERQAAVERQVAENSRKLNDALAQMANAIGSLAKAQAVKK